MTTRKKSVGWLWAMLMAVFMIVTLSPKAHAQKNAMPQTEAEGVAALQAQHDAWVAQATAEIDAVDVNRVVAHNDTFSMHELTAIANTLPGHNNESGRIDYIVRVPGTFGHAVMDDLDQEAFLFRLGAGIGTTYSAGNELAPGLMWNPLNRVVFIKMDCGGLMAIEPNSIVAFGDIVLDGNMAAGAPATGTHCSTTCDPGFWCCGNNNNDQASCTCVRTTVQNPSCGTGGVGARTCEFTITPVKGIAPPTNH